MTTKEMELNSNNSDIDKYKQIASDTLENCIYFNANNLNNLLTEHSNIINKIEIILELLAKNDIINDIQSSNNIIKDNNNIIKDNNNIESSNNNIQGNSNDIQGNKKFVNIPTSSECFTNNELQTRFDNTAADVLKILDLQYQTEKEFKRKTEEQSILIKTLKSTISNLLLQIQELKESSKPKKYNDYSTQTDLEISKYDNIFTKNNDNVNDPNNNLGSSLRSSIKNMRDANLRNYSKNVLNRNSSIKNANTDSSNKIPIDPNTSKSSNNNLLPKVSTPIENNPRKISVPVTPSSQIIYKTFEKNKNAILSVKSSQLLQDDEDPIEEIQKEKPFLDGIMDIFENEIKR